MGVNLLFALTRRAARALGEDYDTEVVEMHHRLKKDAPSGTALRLLEIILEERRLEPSPLRHGRQGITGERRPRRSASTPCAGATSSATTPCFSPAPASGSS